MPSPIGVEDLDLEEPVPWMPTSSGRSVLSRLPCSRSSCVLLMLHAQADEDARRRDVAGRVASRRAA